MAKAPPRKAGRKPPDPHEPTPLERMTDLTQRIVRVPPEEVIKPKAKKQKS